jgi:uncharacterized protein
VHSPTSTCPPPVCPVRRLHAAEHGVKFYACSHALEEYGLGPADLIAEVTGVAGAATYMARCMDEAWTTLVF